MSKMSNDYDVHFSMEGLIYETMSAYVVETFDRAIMTWIFGLSI